ncbi:uncharacterized protein LOC142016665 [Carettochelys insculpta]|uniref:uncharacterized protein LOC142016665 n=1 Tax=Carettochelys insculpta TaxID=44489 RepID=UPI003EBA6334
MQGCLPHSPKAPQCPASPSLQGWLAGHHPALPRVVPGTRMRAAKTPIWAPKWRAPSGTEPDLQDLLWLWYKEEVLWDTSGHRRNDPAFAHLAQGLAARGHPSRTPEQVRCKVKELRQGYMRAQDSARRSSRAPASCPFYHKLRDLLAVDYYSPPHITMETAAPEPPAAPEEEEEDEGPATVDVPSDGESTDGSLVITVPSTASSQAPSSRASPNIHEATWQYHPRARQPDKQPGPASPIQARGPSSPPAGPAPAHGPKAAAVRRRSRPTQRPSASRTLSPKDGWPLTRPSFSGSRTHGGEVVGMLCNVCGALAGQPPTPQLPPLQSPQGPSSVPPRSAPEAPTTAHPKPPCCPPSYPPLHSPRWPLSYSCAPSP